MKCNFTQFMAVVAHHIHTKCCRYKSIFTCYRALFLIYCSGFLPGPECRLRRFKGDILVVQRVILFSVVTRSWMMFVHSAQPKNESFKSLSMSCETQKSLCLSFFVVVGLWWMDVANERILLQRRCNSVSTFVKLCSRKLAVPGICVLQIHSHDVRSLDLSKRAPPSSRPIFILSFADALFTSNSSAHRAHSPQPKFNKRTPNRKTRRSNLVAQLYSHTDNIH